MANSSTEMQIVDPDPVSALIMSIWCVFLSCFGIPLNLFIVITTLKITNIRAVGSNIFIGSLALADSFMLLSFSLHLPYVLSSKEVLCKITGAGLGIFGYIGVIIPPFLALNRYSVVCYQQNKVARLMRPAFSRKGIYVMNGLIWLYQICFNIPFATFDTLGMQSLGLCGAVNARSRNQVVLRIYYLSGYVGVLFISYIPMFIFYTKVTAWIKSMSAVLVMTRETRESLAETKIIMKVTKWITIIPLTLTSPLGIAAFLLEVDPHFIPVRWCRLFVCLFSMSPLFNPIITLTFARPYRLALRNVAKRTHLTAMLFFWINDNTVTPFDVTVPRSVSVFAR